MEKEIAEYTRRCLDDCGFSEEQKVQYLKYLESGQQNERLRLLQAQRKLLMDSLHNAQRQVDVIDYLIQKTERLNF